MIVYGVESNECCEYDVVAMFSTRENAQEYVDQFPNFGYTIREYELDYYTEQIRKGLKLFNVSMNKSGKVLSQNKSHNYHPAVGKYPGDERYCWVLNRTDIPDLMLDVLATSKDDAIRIINGKRLDLLDIWPVRADYEDWEKARRLHPSDNYTDFKNNAVEAARMRRSL